MASKRQTTMAKIAREQAVRERRVRKQEKRDAKRHAKENPATEGVGPDAAAVDEGPEPAPSS